MSEANNKVISTQNELVLFRINKLLCGIENFRINGILQDTEICPVPRAPEYIRGVINVRGEIVTILDLARIFGFPEFDDNGNSAIITVNYNSENVGLFVHEVIDVIGIDADNIEPALPNIKTIDTEYIGGIYKTEEELITILDLEKVIDR